MRNYPLSQEDGLIRSLTCCNAAPDNKGLTMTKSFTQTLDRAALTVFFAIAALPVLGLPLLAVAANGVIQ